MKSSKCFLTCIVLAALALPGFAQSQAPAAPPVWSAGGIDFSGLVDGYYSVNFNHPASRTNQLRNFDVMANQFSLNMAKLVMEHSADPQSHDKPTGEDLEMASKIITPEWLAKTKQELLSLPPVPRPESVTGITTDFESGIKGYYLGKVADQEIWAVDLTAMGVKHGAPDLVVAGNSFRWTWIDRNKTIVDWAYNVIDKAHCLLHEIIEETLMAAGWSYARAHRYSNQGPGCEQDFILELRPELAALKPVCQQDCDRRDRHCGVR